MTESKVWRRVARIGWILCLLVGLAVKGFAQKADQLLDNAAAAYEGSNGIKASLVMQTRNDRQQVAESWEGTVDMRGDKFLLKTPDMITWYDGKTQWVYMERNEEVNVSVPTGEELQMTNPAILLKQYKKDFTPTLKGESTTRRGKAAYEIELLPKRKSTLVKVTLQIEKQTEMPASIYVEAKNGTKMTIQISQIRTGLNQPDSLFVFNEADYPDAEVIDLR